jgi:valyl-tRNA synthetase
MLDKTFEPHAAEPRLYAAWEATGAFAPSADPAATPFTIVIPPPNVTGSLHIGHALNNTLQDVLIRYHRMRGRAALWLPGTDHAGIATQMVVERELAKEGIKRADLGREAFLDRVWQWKAQSGGTIVQQLRRLGASCDWSRERFTLDEGLSRAVRQAFVTLYGEGLIYRDKRLVNWDPQFQTAISDLEVVQVEKRGSFKWDRAGEDPFEAEKLAKILDRDPHGHLYYVEYALSGGGVITVATTRPETLLGDVAIAVHPENETLKHLIGQTATVPLVGRAIPVVADEYADPDKGTGAVKITPAHDFNDFEVGKRHNLPKINVLGPTAAITLPGSPYDGLERYAARKAIVADLVALGCLAKVEPTVQQVPHGDRSNVAIEPLLTDQWYVNAAALAKDALAAVEDGRMVFSPANWDKTYFDWLTNIEPWCISRQLWWGHRIPVWYAHDGTAFSGLDEDDAAAQAEAHFGKAVALRQDEDVLDTWFSSALWPFSTLGWPDKTGDLERFYPTHTLVTGFDIIFFWVARMMMMGLKLTGQVPFQRVVINALVRDEAGQKMSKSKGNVLDPLELVDAYGADPLRFTMVAMSGQGRDIKLSRQRIEGYRNFSTKLWNASRFCQMNECVTTADYTPRGLKGVVNRWIISALARTTDEVTAAFEAAQYDDAANALYRFIWNVFCDWHLELIKPVLNGEDEAPKAEARATTAFVLDQILKLLHPIMPFVTEELWGRLAEFGAKRDGLLITTSWPDIPHTLIDEVAEDEVEWVISLITEIRSIRAEMNVPAAAKLPLVLVGANAATSQRVQQWRDLIERLARLEWVRISPDMPEGAAVFALGEATAALVIGPFIDLAVERARLEKDVVRLESEVLKTEAKLGDPNFVARAPEEVVEEHRERLADHSASIAKIKAALSRLGANRVDA